MSLLLFVTEPTGAAENDQANARAETDPGVHSLQQFQDTISRLQSEQGVYNPELQQTLLDLGLWYRGQGNYRKAVETFASALHVSKVNKGLHQLSQVKLVELLIEGYTSLQDWQAVENNLHYLLWLYRRNYRAGDDRLLPVIERIGRWYMQAYKLHSGGKALSYLVRADNLFDEDARAISSQYGEHARQLVNILYASATVNNQIANDVSDVFVTSIKDIRDAMIPNRRTSPYMNEVAVRDFYFDQSFFRGKRALDRVISIYKSELPDSALDYAKALVYQGDYYLALNRKWNAMRNYQSAYAVLIEQGVDSEDINAIFGQPRQVDPFEIPGKGTEVNSESSYVDAILDVPASGWPGNIRIIASKPVNDAVLQRRGRHAIAGTRYRPRFEDGRPLATEDVSLRYVFRDKR